MAEENNSIQTEQAENSKQQEQPKTSYAVRPDHRHHRRLAYSDQNNMLQIRNYLNIAFMVLAIIGVIIWTQLDDYQPVPNIQKDNEEININDDTILCCNSYSCGTKRF